MPPQRFQSFWHGPPLTPYERLALTSFLDHGHEFVLWSYDRALEVPPGVRLAPAETIVPRGEAFVLEGYDAQGGFVAFSNLFRFELLSRVGGWWVDLDVVCLRAEIPDFETFYALEQMGGKPCEVNNAVLRFPSGHPLVRRCAEESRRVLEQLRQRPGGVTRRDFGQLGAAVIERVTAELGMCGEARHPTTCYPVHWSEIGKIFSRSAVAELETRTAKSYMVHLWNEILVSARLDKTRRPPRGSYLRLLFERHRVDFPPRPPAQRFRDLLGDAVRAWRRMRRRWARPRRSASSSQPPSAAG